MSKEPQITHCTVRDGGDFWHLECRFDDGQKFAAVQVDKDHEQLADDIARYLNDRVAAPKPSTAVFRRRCEDAGKKFCSCNDFRD